MTELINFIKQFQEIDELTEEAIRDCFVLERMITSRKIIRIKTTFAL